ncbi:MAG: hypothetical protein U0793_15005 [Gemmataceae bacterium]
MRRHFTSLLACLIVSASTAPSGAQDKADPDLAFWADAQRQQAAAAAQVIIARDPILAAALRIEGKRLNVWNEPEFEEENALALDPRWLPFIRDDTRPPDLTKRELVTDIKKSEWAYRRIYHDALVKAFQTPPDVFHKSAGDNKGVTWEQLMNNPAFYRGKVVSIRGELRKLTVLPAPESLRTNFEYVYEAWIKTPGKGLPILAVFTVLPDKFKDFRNKDLDQAEPVEFEGYFIMRYKYTKRNDEEAITPFLIGQTLRPGVAPAEPSGWTVPLTVIFILGAIFVVVVALMVGLRWWYGIEDRRIMAKINEVRAARSQEAENELLRDDPAGGLSPERNGAADHPQPSQKPGDSTQTGV